MAASVVSGVHLGYRSAVRRFRNIVLAWFVVCLTVLTGIGGAAHAMFAGCIPVACETHLHAPEQASHMDHMGAAQHIKPQHTEPSSDTESMAHDDCNPLLCNALVLLPHQPSPRGDRPETGVIWLVLSLVALAGPDSPDRPPNL